MKKILGIDVGPASIGWAVVLEGDDGSKEILALNSRIIPLSADEKKEFGQGLAATKNANRRLKRSARRNNQRYKLRRKALVERLTQMGMLPDEMLIKLPTLELYGLRYTALRDKISLPELGRILVHLNQKRGYKSLRGTEDPEASPIEGVEENAGVKKVKKTDWQERFDSLEDALEHRGLMPGEYFFEQLKADPLYRVKEKICGRNRYQDEFDRLWEKQHEYYPDVLTDENRRYLRNEVIFYQRPLKSAKHLVSDCDFESFWAKDKTGTWTEMHPKVAPKSSPLFQFCKVWESVNTISITDRMGKDVAISLEQKHAIVEDLECNPKLSATALLKKLNLKARDHIPNQLIKEKGIQGNLTRCILLQRFEQAGLDPGHWLNLPLQLETYVNTTRPDPDTGEVIPRQRFSSDVEHSPYYRLWHLLYSSQDNDSLVINLQKMLGCTEEQARIISAVDFTKGGFGNKSSKAMRHILPYLIQGEVYSEACNSAGYNHSNSITKEQNLQRELLDKMEGVRQNSLRNPVVEKILNQLVHIVNQVMASFGRPDEIRVELARELKQNKDERGRAFKEINKKEREKDNLRKTLMEEPEFRALGRTRVSARNLEKYRLWLEFDKQSPYEINKTVGIAELFREYEIEHIIPKSLLFDDSFANKTICHRNHNSGTNAKNQMTAHDFMKRREGGQHYEDYTKFVADAYNGRRISKTKWQRLLTTAENIPAGFIDRQLRETQYIAKKAKEMLHSVCREVTSSTGSVTDYLKQHWGWSEALLNLNWNRFPEERRREETDPHGKVNRQIKDWTKRADQRHHALDALTVACTKPSYIKQLNDLNQKVQGSKEESKYSILKKEVIQSERPFSPAQVQEALENCLVSYKPGQRVATRNTNKIRKGKKIIHRHLELTPRGAFHEESVYGLRQTPDHGPEPKAVMRWNISKLDKPKQFNQIVDRRVRNLLIDAFIRAGGVLERIPKKGEGPDNMDFALARFLEMGGIVVPSKLNAQQEAANKKAMETIQKTEFTLRDHTRGLDVPVRRVRMVFNYTLIPLHASENGQTFAMARADSSEDAKKVDYVNLKNNHHFALYQDADGKIQECIVTFWEAFQRQKNGLPIVIKNTAETLDKVLQETTGYPETLWESLPKADWQYLLSGQQNEMFVFDMSRDEILTAIQNKQFKKISPNLFRLRKISEGINWFNHHLESEPRESLEDKKFGKTIQASTKTFREREVHKVRLDHLGRIVSLDEQIMEAKSDK